MVDSDTLILFSGYCQMVLLGSARIHSPGEFYHL